MDIFLPSLLNGLVNGSAFALVALGFALICNTTRFFHFAHGGVYVFSGYIFYTFYTQLGLSIWLALPCTMILAAIAGILIDLIIYQPLGRHGASPTMHMLSSLGLYIIIVNVLCMIYDDQSKALVSSLPSTIEFCGLNVSGVRIATIITFVVVFIGFSVALRYSSLGLKLRAMRDNPVLLSLYGINPYTIRLFVFSIGSALCALASILIGLDIGINPNVGMTAVITAAVALIVGGMGNFKGAVWAALALGCLQSITVWQMSDPWKDMVTFLVLMLFLLVRPQGITGRKGRLEEGGNT